MPKDLNKAIKKEHYSIQTMQDIVKKFHSKKYFQLQMDIDKSN